MKKKLILGLSTAVAVSSLPQAVAFQADDTITVTGSYIQRQRQEDLPSPLATVSNDDIENIGAFDIKDITQTLTINTGAENNPDAFTQAGTLGTSNINLRGLGVGSTLVLLNGSRQVTTATATNQGVQFVDTAQLVPLIAVERVEILKDGASALYGSDAVAGVVNFITREDYDGVLLSGTYENQIADGSWDSYQLQGLAGKAFDRGSALVAVEYSDQGALTTEERRFSRVQDDTSALGNPGSVFGAPGLPEGIPLIDPTGCEAFGGIPDIRLEGTRIGLCGFDFGDFYSLVPEQEKLNVYARGEMDVTDIVSASLEVSYADAETKGGLSPSFPFLQLDRAVVPSFNPNTPFTDDNVAFFGRALGNGKEGTFNTANSETWRVAGAVSGNDFLKNGTWEVSAVRARNSYVLETPDTVTDRFQCALSGFGAAPAFDSAIGIDCSDQNPFLTANGRTVPAAGTFFNPFASSFTTAPNDPALVAYLFENQVRDLTQDLTVVQAVVSTDLFDLPAGPAAIAAGTQYRRTEQESRFDEISNGDGFAFLIGEQDYEGEQDVYALFAEVALPVTDLIDLQAALRFEDYGDDQGGSTVDPKVAVLFRAFDNLSLRGSFSTSFRAPSVFQQQGSATTLVQVLDDGQQAFVANRISGGSDLEAEESTAWNIGATVLPTPASSISFDFYSYDFENVITPQNPQALLNRAPNSDAITRSPDGTVIRIDSDFVNASSVQTSGIDASALWDIELGAGTLTPSASATWILNYDLEDPVIGGVDGEGARNFNNFGTSVPEWRANLGLGYRQGAHTLNTYVRYISGYEDDQNCSDGTTSQGGACAGGALFQEVDDDIRWDAQYRLSVAEFTGRDAPAAFTLGVKNITDQEPPQLFTNGGYDSKVADPLGRLLYATVELGF